MGWIKLDRQIQNNWLWVDDEPFDKRSAWIDLLMLANYEDTKVAYKGEIITCKRGDVNLSIKLLAERWKWSRQKVKRFLLLLESDGMVTTNVTTHRTTITLENYGVYQDVHTTDVTTNVTTNGQQVLQQVDSKCNNQRTQLRNKEIKEIKEINNLIDLSESSTKLTKSDYENQRQLVKERLGLA